MSKYIFFLFSLFPLFCSTQSIYNVDSLEIKEFEYGETQAYRIDLPNLSIVSSRLNNLQYVFVRHLVNKYQILILGNEILFLYPEELSVLMYGGKHYFHTEENFKDFIYYKIFNP